MMFNRADLKERAKSVLQTTYWMSFAVCIVYGVISGVISGSADVINAVANVVGELSPSFLAVTILLPFVILAIAFFVLQPLAVGLYRFFIRAATEERAEFSELFFAFGKDYWNVVKVSLMKMLFLLLWVLLSMGILFVVVFTLAICFSDTFGSWLSMYELMLDETTIEELGMFFAGYFSFLAILLVAFIPVIIKSYQYFMVEFLVADNPKISWREALSKSKRMTHKNKWKIFVLELSFIGWQLLGVLACCVGTIFVAPYIYATYAQLYLKLRANVYGSAEPVIAIEPELEQE